jgi:hypothetical protein
VRSGIVDSDASTALVALALPPGEARERALDHLVTHRAQLLQATPAVPHDPSTRGWGWTPETFGWVEPTSRALLALRSLRPEARTPIEDGLAVLADRECVGGGWNYGNRVVLGVDLPPYVQTTAAALLALQADLPEQRSRGLSCLRTAWRREPGGLSLALTLAALRVHDDAEADAVAARLARAFDETAFLGDVIATAWATIATGVGLERMRIAP